LSITDDPGAVGARVLVVDDDAGVRDVLAITLNKAGYRTRCAKDGEDGWEALHVNKFDALITDHDMPRLTGLDLIRRVRAAPLQVPVLLMSGRLPWDDSRLFKLLRPGMTLAKPFSMADMLLKLRCILIPTGSAVPTDGS